MGRPLRLFYYMYIVIKGECMNIVNFFQVNFGNDEKTNSLLKKGKYTNILENCLHKFTPINRVRTFVMIPTLTEILNLDHSPSKYEERVRMRSNFLKKERELDPEVVFWDYAEVYNLEKENNKPEGIFKNVLVSTNGDSIILTASNKFYLQSNIENKMNGKYKRIRMGMDGNKYMLHRVIGCTFVPVPKDKDIRSCITNHLDNNPGNNQYLNFEWATIKENNIHGIDIGARKTGDEYYQEKPFLLEVISDNKFKGRKYVLKGLKDCGECGFNIPGLLQVVNGIKKSYYGHDVKIISPEETNSYEIGMPDDIKSLFLTDRNYFSTDIKPIIGEVIEGPFKGFQFSFFGATELNRYFQQANVFKVISGERLTHKNCKWRYGTISEAIEIHNKLTNEIYQTL